MKVLLLRYTAKETAVLPKRFVDAWTIERGDQPDRLGAVEVTHPEPVVEQVPCCTVHLDYVAVVDVHQLPENICPGLYVADVRQHRHGCSHPQSSEEHELS